MAIVSLIDNQRRTHFFREITLLNLEYWQAWLAEAQSADVIAINLERNSIVRAILFGLDLDQAAILCTKSSLDMTSQLPPIADMPMPASIPEDSHWW